MNNTKNTEAERLTFWERIYLPEIARGLGLTFKEMLKPKFTRQYPEESGILKAHIAVVPFLY